MKYEKIKGSQNHHLFRPFSPSGELRDAIWVRFHRTGKGRLEESLKTSHLGEARDKRDVRIAEFLGEKPRLKKNVFLVEDKFTEFLELKKGKSKGTYDSISNQWNTHLKEYFGSKLLDEVTETEWLTYVNKKRVSHPNRKFFNDRKYLSMFLNWVWRAGLIVKVPKLENVDPELDSGIVLTDDEVKSLLENSNDDLDLQIKMALTMGMRVGEILSMEWSQINWDKKEIFLPAYKTKIRKKREFVMSETAHTLLKERFSASNSIWVFPSPKDSSKSVGKGGNKTAFNNAVINSNINPDITFHDLRHTFLTRAFKQAVNPALICTYAGLSLEEAWRTYLHFRTTDTAVVALLVEVST